MDLTQEIYKSKQLRSGAAINDVVISNNGTQLTPSIDMSGMDQRGALPIGEEAGGTQSTPPGDMSIIDRRGALPIGEKGNLSNVAAAVRAIFGGVGNAFKGALATAGEVGDTLENIVPLGYINFGPNGFSYSREKPEGANVIKAEDAFENLLKTIGVDVPKGDGPVEALGRGLVQFATGMAMAPVKGLGYLSMVARGGFADALFDPEGGNLSSMLKELGLTNPVIEFLDSKVEAGAGPEERLKARIINATEGALAGTVVDLIVAGFKAARSNEGLRGTIRNKLISAGEAAEQRIAERGTGMTLGMGVDPTEPVDKALAAAGKIASKVRLSASDRKFIEGTATKKGVLDKALANKALAAARETKNNFPPSEGWTPISVGSNEKAPSFTLDKDGNVKIKWQQPAYEFNKPLNKRVSPEAHQKNLVDRMVSDVNELVNRAKNGDQKAVDIIGEANWYRAMRTRLRREFGGLGDVFADILGATSAQTNVTRNYENSLEVLRRFTRGEFDNEIKQYEDYLKTGGPKGTTLFAKDKDPEDSFALIRNAAGKMFGANSPAATEALLDMFRQVKAGSSPKTVNFTGNLIGFGNDATIDVWAARYLRKISGRDRIPPPAEPGVSGKHLSKSTMDNPQIGQEFGFGQKVFAEAVQQINSSGVVKEFDQSLGDMGADDLQAVIWFLEKENWTNNNWTSKAGEGGSLDFESKFGGSPDRERVAELRSVINSAKSTPEQIKEAEDELAGLVGSPQRFVGGISRERPGNVPTNVQQAEIAEELTQPLVNDKTVIGYQANNTVGEFVGETERALNFEVVTQTNFDPTNLRRAMVEAGRKYDQDAVFISKVVDGTSETARPGVEIYFKERQGVDYAQKVTAILRERGIDGFTFVTDARQADRVDVQAGTNEATAGLVGIRFQYVPEFDETFDATNAAQIFADKAVQFREVMRDVAKIDGITYADVVHYETEVFKNTDRPGTEWINGGTGYGEYLGGPVRTRTGEGGDG